MEQKQYQYSSFSILIGTACLLPCYALGIWTINRTHGTWFYFCIIGLIYMLGVNIRGLLRLGESIIIDSKQITQKSAFKTVQIPWDEVTVIKEVFSLLEFSQLIILSNKNEKITIAPKDFGYFDDLYSSIETYMKQQKSS